MHSVKGIGDRIKVKLSETIKLKKPQKVNITFIDEIDADKDEAFYKLGASQLSKTYSSDEPEYKVNDVYIQTRKRRSPQTTQHLDN